MPADQFNVRLPDPYPQQVRVRAAQLGIKPKDVLVEALDLLFAQGTPVASTGSPPVEQPPRRSGRGRGGAPGCPDCGGTFHPDAGNSGALTCDGCGYVKEPSEP